MPARTDYDVAIVGARCAGAATALLLARRGLRVLVVDRARRGSDTLSTHALLRPGVVQLHRWGLLDRLAAAGTPPVTRTTFHYGDDTVPITLRPVAGTHALYAPRRTVLDPLLLDAAEEAGADVVTGARVTGLRRDATGRVLGLDIASAKGTHAVTATTTVGADGLRSLVADQVGSVAEPVGRFAGTCSYGYLDGRLTAGFEWFYGPGLTAGLIPTDGEQTLAFVCRPAQEDGPGGWATLLAAVGDAWPAGRDLVAAGTPTGAVRRFRGVVSMRRRAWGPGWALVGDAGYFVDPMSSHGMSQALRDAELLADALTTPGAPGPALAAYERRRDELSAPITAAVDRIASFDWDLASVRPDLLALTSAMSDEVDAITALGDPSRPVLAA